MKKVLLISLFLTIFAGEAFGSGFYVTQIGGTDAAPTEPNATAVFWNPAALGPIEGTSCLLDITTILRTVKYDKPTEGLPGYEGTTEEAKLFNVSPLPFFGVTSDFGLDSWHFGLGIYAPFGSSTEWDDPDGPQRYQSIEGSITTMYLTPAVSYTARPWLHFGAGFSYVRSLFNSKRRIDLTDDLGGVTEDPAMEAELTMDGIAGNQWNTTVGGLVYFEEEWAIGMSYSSPLFIKNQGVIKVAPIGSEAEILLGGTTAEAEAELETTFPQSIKLSAQYFLRDNLRVRGYLEWVDWSQLETITIKRGKTTNILIPEETISEKYYQDAWGVRLGSKYWLKDNLAFFGGLGFDSNAVPDESQGADISDSNKIALSVGTSLGLDSVADFLMADAFKVTFGFNQVFLFSRDIEESQVYPPANGTYKSSASLINLNIELRFL
ncbi:MAG: outer membrane protein transport protein [Deltaproteobacteria bacterium]|nr:MAG: outer membrane protein transport protein [Deltaproteobacteria bacterium]